MKQKTMFMTVIAFTLVLASCSKEPVQVPVQTVEWFKEHKTEREAQINKCESNPGELEETPNCVNATDARNSLIWSSRTGGNPVKPLTFGAPKKKEVNK
jgi:hypothetical protein